MGLDKVLLLRLSILVVIMLHHLICMFNGRYHLKVSEIFQNFGIKFE